MMRKSGRNSNLKVRAALHNLSSGMKQVLKAWTTEYQTMSLSISPLALFQTNLRSVPFFKQDRILLQKGRYTREEKPNLSIHLKMIKVCSDLRRRMKRLRKRIRVTGKTVKKKKKLWEIEIMNTLHILNSKALQRFKLKKLILAAKSKFNIFEISSEPVTLN